MGYTLRCSLFSVIVTTRTITQLTCYCREGGIPRYHEKLRAHPPNATYPLKPYGIWPNQGQWWLIIPSISPLVPDRVGIAGDTFLPAATDYWVGESNHSKNMLVKMDHFPNYTSEN